MTQPSPAEGLILPTSGWVWVVVPIYSSGPAGPSEIRVYASWAALHDDFPTSPKVPNGKMESWFISSWAEPGDNTLFSAIQRDIRI